MNDQNVTLNSGFSQVCVWPSTVVGKEVDEFVEWVKKEFGVRIQYLEEIKTTPDTDDSGNPIPNK